MENLIGQHITGTTTVSGLTRGKQYELLAHTIEKEFVRVRDDKGRCRWIRADNFDLSGTPIPTLTAWRYDEPVVDILSGRDETNNWVDIRLKFDDGTERWCQMATPDYLKQYVEQNPEEPMFCARNLIVVRDLAEATVEQVLMHLDDQGELMVVSDPLEPSEEPSE